MYQSLIYSLTGLNKKELVKRAIFSILGRQKNYEESEWRWLECKSVSGISQLCVGKQFIIPLIF
jgi:hypothetical protein